MKKKVLLAYNFILHYRIPLFNLLADKYDLTVLHSGYQMTTGKDKFEEIIFPTKKAGPFFIQSGILNEVKKEKYDVIIFLFDVRWLNTIWSIYACHKKAKVILWGAWLTDSSIANFMRLYLSKRVSGNIFYTEKSKKDFVRLGLNSDLAFVANNTFDVGERVKSFNNDSKNRILFVGSLDKRKQNDVLIQAFYNVINLIPNDIILTIIGEGEEELKLKELVNDLQITDRVVFTGKITNPDKLKEFYRQSIVSVSFGQAGLSVLQSLGFGVPFLTKKNAISGGEKENIVDGVNSIFCDDNIESLEMELKKLCSDIKFSNKLGENAYKYYSEYCTIENMCQGFIDAIENTSAIGTKL